MESPDDAANRGFEILLTFGRLGIGKIRNRIKPTDRKSRMAIDNDPLGERSPCSMLKARQRDKQKYPAKMDRDMVDLWCSLFFCRCAVILGADKQLNRDMGIPMQAHLRHQQ